MTTSVDPSTPADAALANALNGIVSLDHLGIIHATGEDAVKFLHGQLSQDLVLLPVGQARLAAYCSPKGRMLASFIAFKRSPQDVLLLCSKDILAPTLKRLSMFVMRAKLRLSDASADYQLYGLLGGATNSVAAYAHATGVTADFDTESQTIRITLPPAGDTPRQLWIAPATAPAPQGLPLAANLWHWSEVRSGVATITAPVVEAFVPQMLNYESVGGINFKKGCYPGQEVVARSQFRGTLKRRAFIVHAEAAMQAGDELFAATDPADSTEPAASVVQAAPAPGGGFDAIVCVQLSSITESTALQLGHTGVRVEFLPLPYKLLEDV